MLGPCAGQHLNRLTHTLQDTRSRPCDNVSIFPATNSARATWPARPYRCWRGTMAAARRRSPIACTAVGSRGATHVSARSPSPRRRCGGSTSTSAGRSRRSPPISPSRPARSATSGAPTASRSAHAQRNRRLVMSDWGASIYHQSPDEGPRTKDGARPLRRSSFILRQLWITNYRFLTTTTPRSAQVRLSI